MYEDYPRIVMYDILKKYIPDLQPDMLKKHYVHVARTIKDKELKKKVDDEFILEFQKYKDEEKKLMQESIKWITETKEIPMIKVTGKSVWSRSHRRDNFYDTTITVNVNLVSVTDQNIIVKEHDGKYDIVLTYRKGFWSDYGENNTIYYKKIE